MDYGICVCGLNGSGKTTLAKALAKKINFKCMDIEDYYFTRSSNPYKNARTRHEVELMLLEDIQNNPKFVFSAVNGNISSEINKKYKLVIYLYAPTDIRMKRIRQRAFDKFGDRVLPGGDMYDQEEEFFQFVSQRTPHVIEEWLNTLSCKVIYLDGTNNLHENIKAIISSLN